MDGILHVRRARVLDGGWLGLDNGRLAAGEAALDDLGAGGWKCRHGRACARWTEDRSRKVSLWPCARLRQIDERFSESIGGSTVVGRMVLGVDSIYSGSLKTREKYPFGSAM